MTALVLGSCNVRTPAASAPAPIPASQAREPFESGLERLNEYRLIVRLPPVPQSPTLSAGCFNHARYLVKNSMRGADVFVESNRLRVSGFDPAVHKEAAGNGWFSREGETAAQASSVLSGPVSSLSGRELVDQWITFPLSALLILDPQLTQVGFGDFCEAGQCMAVLSYKRGLDKDRRLALYQAEWEILAWKASRGPIPPFRGRLKSPIKFPPDGASISLTSYQGGDRPDLLAACPGYTLPTGLPISFQAGLGSNADCSLAVSQHSITRDGLEVQHCLVTAASFARSKDPEAKIAKNALDYFGAAVLVPRDPMVLGSTYTISLTVDSKVHAWSFKVAPPSSPAATPMPATQETTQRAAP